ncbi:cell division protein PerM [Aeromicrobium wangtongii]|uniref:DUF6350 family protein n=1 Tax=Aeromicrobium wangtongii TaxID=2969247 RepID=A0ABY5M5I2_9ACTN|nr:DUF6350 family protein [Aeromicrobium wangtongii]MCD9198889.1 DUF6350 family protein [Aeromicrobium wangtongii]UUP13072.1 DUF6350 family protein [Aeromicrobium wangtongii]
MPAPVETPYLRPAFLTAIVATIVSWAVAAVFVVIAQGASGLSAGSLARTTIRTWLVALGAGIDAGPVSIGVVPIGATLLCIALVAQAAVWVVADPLVELAAFAATAAGAYGTIAAIASAATNVGDVDTSVVRAAFGAFVVGGLGAVWGSVRRHGDADRWWFTAVPDVRAAVRAAVPGVLAVLGAAAAIVAVLLVTHVQRAGDLWALLDPGVGGGVALAAGSVLAVPTLVLWTASALLGPGFAIGTGTSVDLTGSQLGQVPGFPLLAALPTPGTFPGWVFVLGLVPLLGGMLSGWRVDPGGRTDLVPRLALGAAAGAVAGLVLGVLVGMSGGAVGPGRLADAGPPMFTPLLVAVPVMALGGALGAALAHYRGLRAPRPSDTSAPGGPRLWKRHQSPGADRRVGGA